MKIIEICDLPDGFDVTVDGKTGHCVLHFQKIAGEKQNEPDEKQIIIAYEAMLKAPKLPPELPIAAGENSLTMVNAKGALVKLIFVTPPTKAVFDAEYTKLAANANGGK